MPRGDAGRKRCEIYTRKACEAFVQSQRHEGWRPLTAHYDDGGYSGGTLDRPALQQLLADIRAGKVQIVVVYKVDRLTRSLTDFAKLIELFDAHGVSFVSVTQQFNTTTSMGRLMLNVLLSFAQFEREVTGERIRDKIAASKKKGLWMGGSPPLGYRASDRALVIDPAEAETVRRIFALYRELGCVRRVKDEADRLGLRTKRRTTANGAECGGAPFSRGHLYRLLSNPIYTGRIAHKGQLYPGQHPALIDDETWTSVRDRLAASAGAQRRRPKAAEPSLLAGLLVDAQGQRLTPSHAVKKGRRYRYYISATLITATESDGVQNGRLAAREIEDCVTSILIDALTNPTGLFEGPGLSGMPGDQIRRLLGRAARLAAALRRSPEGRAKIVRELVAQVIVDDKRIIIKLRYGVLVSGEVPSRASNEPGASTIELTTAVDFKRRGVATKVVLPGLTQQNQPSRCDPALIKAVVRGRAWLEELATGRARSLEELAKRAGISRRYILRLIDLAFLSPRVIDAILEGRHPVALTATRLSGFDLPLDWAEQHKLLAS